MTENVETMEDKAPDTEGPELPPETERTIQLEDIKSPNDLRKLMDMASQGLLQNAHKKMQSTGYHEAVQLELTLHKGDMHQFALHRLVDFMEKQETRIGVLEGILGSLIKKDAN